MQGQSSTPNSYMETFYFNHGSSANNLGLVQHNLIPVNASGPDGHTSMGWMGQSSSSMSAHHQVSLEELSQESGWLYLSGAHAGTGQRLEERDSVPTSALILDGVSNGLITNEPPALQSSSSYSVPQNIDLNVTYEGDNGDICHDMGSGTVGNVVEEIDHRSGSSGGQKMPYKRKMPEETSGPLGRNSSNTQQVENSDCQVIPSLDNSSSSRSLDMYAPSSNNFLNSSQSDQVTPRLGYGMIGAESYVHRTSSVAGNTESLHRNIRPRRTANNQDLLPASASLSGTSVINSHVQLPNQSSTISSLNRYTNFPGNIASTLQNGSSLAVQPSAHPGLPPHNMVASSGVGVQLSPAPPRFPSPSNYVGQSGSHGWHPRASIPVRDVFALRSGDPRALDVFLRPGVLMTRAERSNVGYPPIRPELQSIAAAHRRAILVSEVRHALQLLHRLQTLQDEVSQDVAIIDGPEFYGEPEEEEYDMHEDMRLDVDDMSYEELLALGEQIGSVSTGLSEEAILAHLRHRRYQTFTIGTPVDEEPCCICQDEYVNGQELGKLDCGHDFHFDCIKQWLMQKNSCPICKMTALAN